MLDLPFQAAKLDPAAWDIYMGSVVSKMDGIPNFGQARHAGFQPDRCMIGGGQRAARFKALEYLP
jgi:hypothetical protein